MGMMTEFKKFAVKGNVMDMAVGIIIGAAFGKIVSTFVDGVLMPPLGLLIGGTDFTKLSIVLKAGTENTEPVLLQWGAFVQTTVNFLIIAFAIFLMVKVMNRLQAKEEAKPEAPAAPSKEELLLTEIRDLLKEKTK